MQCISSARAHTGMFSKFKLLLHNNKILAKQVFWWPHAPMFSWTHAPARARRSLCAGREHAGEHAWAPRAHFGDDVVGDHAHAQHLCQHADLPRSHGMLLT